MLIVAIVLISSALALYTAGVWAEHRAGSLRPAHAALFAAGLTADASGTWAMSLIAASGGGARGGAGAASALYEVMALTGALALALMAAHLAWALVVLVRNRPAEKRTFHRFSVAVWALWLVPYVTGMAGAMV